MASNRTKSARVAIVGAGPGGAMLAFLLARGGVRVTLIERHTDLAREFRGEGISPGGIEAFETAGLMEDFLSLPAAPIERVELFIKGRQTLALSVGDILPGPAPMRLMAQPPLLEMLIAKASEYPGFEMVRGTLVRDVLVTDGRVSGLVVGEAGTPGSVTADYVIAADGRYSRVRERLELELADRRQFFDVVWCKLPRPDVVPRGTVYALLLGDLFGLVLPAEDDQIQIGRIIEKGKFGDFKGGDMDWFEKVAASLPEPLRAAFEKARDQVSAPVLLEVECGALPRWSVPGLCFIGDAAHPMSPVGAQGINMALRDAVAAANHFGPLLLDGQSGTALDKAAANFETERRVEVDWIQRQQNTASVRLRAASRMSGFIRAVPDRWLAALARRVARGGMVRRFASGVVNLELTFGRDA